MKYSAGEVGSGSGQQLSSTSCCHTVICEPCLLLNIINFGFWYVPLGLTHVITIDLHHKEIQGFFDVPVDNLRASPFIMEYIKDNVSITITLG